MAIIADAFQHLDGGSQRAPTIVPTIIFNVLEKQDLGLVKLRDSQNVIEECAASILETALLARDAEWLTRKTCAQHVVGRNCARFYFGKVAVRRITEVEGVSLLGMRIVVGGKDALVPQFLQGKAKAAYAAKQINESKTRHLPDHLRQRLIFERGDLGNSKGVPLFYTSQSETAWESPLNGSRVGMNS